MTEKEVIGPTYRKILRSMKPGEEASCVVAPSFFKDDDTLSHARKDAPVTIDIKLHKLDKIEDLYKDRTTFYKSLRKGEGSASPRSDYIVWCK